MSSRAGPATAAAAFLLPVPHGIELRYTPHMKSRFAPTTFFAALAAATALAQVPPGGRGGAPQPPRTAKAAALYDITGYWASVVTEDWRFRMVTPPKGDYTGVALNPEGRKVADTWDPSKDEAAGEQCRSYGAPAILRVPGRLHITWQDDE